MTKHRSMQKQLTLREAEGYLDLLSGGPICRPTATLRQSMAARTLDALDRTSDYGSWSAHAFYLRGQAYRILERYREAVEPLREAVRLDPENIHVWLSLGWCYKRCGRLDLAIESLEDGLAVDPHQAILYYNLACYWSLAKNVQLAVPYLAKAFELDAGYRDLVMLEHDFDPIRDDPQFQALTTVIV